MYTQPPPIHTIHLGQQPLTWRELAEKFADDTTTIGEISNNDESSYRGEINNLAEGAQRAIYSTTQHQQNQGAGC